MRERERESERTRERERSGVRIRVKGLECMVWGVGFRVESAGFRV